MRLINDLHIKYDMRKRSYTVKCYISDSFKSDLFLKFDTGAVHTMITLSMFINEDSDSYGQRSIIAEQLRNSNYSKVKLSAAFGASKDGILCHASDVTLDKYKLDDFYFYLVIPNKEDENVGQYNPIINRPKALLGVDFISCCDFECKTGQDIEITDFHPSRYVADKQWLDRSKILDVDSLDFSSLLDYIPVTESQNPEAAHNIRAF